jgi:heat-inducible transcriptional repressor
VSVPTRSSDTQISLKNGAQISERALHFLKALIERHIRDGQPVGSRTLARDTGLELSPATVRNVMADLEEMGLVSSPHASAGRVPTASGYRLFVDSLLTVLPLDEQEVERLQSGFAEGDDAKALLESASQLLSGVTRMAGIVMVPRRVIHTERPCTPAQLTEASNFLTDMFNGQDMGQVRRRLVEDLKRTHRRMDELMLRAVAMAQRVMETAERKDDLVIAGQTNLMEFQELSRIERLKSLFDAFSEKRQILDLLDRCIAADGVQIFIGDESGFELLDDCSLVTTTYRVEDQILGVLGVIGPTRMDYQRVIPVVDVTARLLAAALKQQ